MATPQRVRRARQRADDGLRRRAPRRPLPVLPGRHSPDSIASHAPAHGPPPLGCGHRGGHGQRFRRRGLTWARPGVAANATALVGAERVLRGVAGRWVCRRRRRVLRDLSLDPGGPAQQGVAESRVGVRRAGARSRARGVPNSPASAARLDRGWVFDARDRDRTLGLRSLGVGRRRRGMAGAERLLPGLARVARSRGERGVASGDELHTARDAHSDGSRGTSIAYPRPPTAGGRRKSDEEECVAMVGDIPGPDRCVPRRLMGVEKPAVRAVLRGEIPRACRINAVGGTDTPVG